MIRHASWLIVALLLCISPQICSARLIRGFFSYNLHQHQQHHHHHAPPSAASQTIFTARRNIDDRGFLSSSPVSLTSSTKPNIIQEYMVTLLPVLQHMGPRREVINTPITDTRIRPINGGLENIYSRPPRPAAAAAAAASSFSAIISSSSSSRILIDDHPLRHIDIDHDDGVDHHETPPAAIVSHSRLHINLLQSALRMATHRGTRLFQHRPPVPPSGPSPNHNSMPTDRHLTEEEDAFSSKLHTPPPPPPSS